MYKPRHNCIYVTQWDKCNHLDRRGMFGRGKDCLLEVTGVKDCTFRIPHPRPKGPPPPACGDNDTFIGMKVPPMPPVKKPRPPSKRRDTC